MTNIEGDIRDILRAAASNKDVPMPPPKPAAKEFAPLAVREASVQPPSYIDPDPEASKVAKLTGAAVATEFEKAAVEIERLGDKLKGMVEEVLLHVSHTAESYRKKGTMLYKEIESVTTMANLTMKKSEEFRQQLKVNNDIKPDTTVNPDQDKSGAEGLQL
jgi:hypothetical protein